MDLYRPRLTLDASRLEVLQGLRWPLLLLGVVLVAGAVWILRKPRTPDPTRPLIRIVGVSIAVYLVTFGWLMPAFEPTKSYAAECRWIRAEIGAGDHLGLVWPDLAHHKKGAFAYYLGTLVDLLPSEADVERFFAAYPGSLVLVHESCTDLLLGSSKSDWHARRVRELVAGGNRYVAFRGS